MKRIMLVVAYDGTAYCGFQKQPNGNTIEAELNKHLSALFGEETEVIGASRTDSGVHALGNVAVFDSETRMPGEKVAYALNQRLPADIIIQKSVEVPLDFHPRHCDSVKTYEYNILNRTFPLPLERNRAHFVYGDIDLEKMQEAADLFLGEHSFQAFSSVKTQAKSFVRTIYNLTVTREGHWIRIRVSGSGFLYNMVRIIAGTLLDVGMGRMEPAEVEKAITSGKRELAGPTAPPQGLTLVGIDYPGLDIQGCCER